MPVCIDSQEIEPDILDSLYERLNLTLRRLGRSDTVKIEIMVCPKKKVIELEKDYFSSDTPTDVLSFPVETNPDQLLGSIFICHDIAIKQAREAGISYSEEVVQLAEHGMLHLLGYRH